MTKQRKHAELIKAWADGAEIEYRWPGEEWRLISTPKWEDAFEYRIYQKPKPDVVQYWCASSEPLKSPMENNLKLTFDGETGKLKLAEVL